MGIGVKVARSGVAGEVQVQILDAKVDLCESPLASGFICIWGLHDISKPTTAAVFL
jgi:hypothetical protein